MFSIHVVGNKMKWSTFYAPPCVSVLSDDMPSGGSLVRLDRVREGAGGGGCTFLVVVVDLHGRTTKNDSQISGLLDHTVFYLYH